MANIMKKAVVIGSFLVALSVAAVAPSSAQTVTVEPNYAGPPQEGYIDPYAAYAYNPGPRVERAWEFPAGHDSTGQASSYRELGVKPGPSSGAPANPCFLSQRVQNRC
jgi:hypothetical protein